MRWTRKIFRKKNFRSKLRKTKTKKYWQKDVSDAVAWRRASDRRLDIKESLSISQMIARWILPRRDGEKWIKFHSTYDRSIQVLGGFEFSKAEVELQ